MDLFPSATPIRPSIKSYSPPSIRLLFTSDSLLGSEYSPPSMRPIPLLFAPIRPLFAPFDVVLLPSYSLLFAPLLCSPMRLLRGPAWPAVVHPDTAPAPDTE